MPEKDWVKHIESLEKITKPSTEDEVKDAIINAVKKRIPKKHFGVLFSGGVDSTLLSFLCKQNTNNFTCYSVGLEGSPDIIAGEKVAEELDLDLKQKTFTIDEVEKLFKKVVKIFKKPDVLSVGVGSVVVAAVELAKKDKVNTFFGGLGSEEIFAGYQRHLEAKDKHAECWRGLKAMWQRDFTRDFAVASKLKIKVLCPLLDDEVIVKAMGIDINRKINSQHKKIILREIAEDLGIPQEFAWREKKAAQYGSWFDKAMEKLAKRNGFNTKQEYVESLKN